MTKRREFVENGDNKQQIEYAEICKTIKKKGKRNNHGIKEPDESQKNAEARPRQV